MKAPASSSPFRKFLRGLTNTCLLLLLPVQLMLAWVADLDQPTRMPDFLTERITAQLAEQGVRLQARRFWMLPDLTLAADDLTLGVDGLTGDVFTAMRVEIALNPARLFAGQIDPTQVRVAGARLWCPASAASRGVRRPLIDALALDVTKEGRWINLRSFQARAGKITCHLSGELPTKFLRDGGGKPTGRPLARELAEIFATLETAVDVAEHSGGASVTIRCRGRSDGIAELEGLAVLGEGWSDEGLGLIQVRGLNLRGTAKIAGDGDITDWRLEGGAQEFAWRTVSAARLDIRARGQGRREDAVAELTLGQVKFAGAELAQASLSARSVAGGEQIAYRLLSAASSARGTVTLHRAGGAAISIDQAHLAGEEIDALPDVRPLLRSAGIDLRGEVLLRDVAADLSSQGTVGRASGEIALAGFRGLGLTAEAISPERPLPLRTRFDFDVNRSAAPLRLRDLRLASVTGDFDCELKAGGAFRLALNGELAPASLDRLLGAWWVDLWRLFLVRENPYASIEVASHWGALTSVTKGRALLRRFDFMGAPFRRVEISVDADAKQTVIGLHRLAGGDTPDGGSVDGTVTWDWSKPIALAGPVVRAEGDLQPWIAARCAGKEFGEALRGLTLPADRRFTVLLSPGARGPEVKTTITCGGEFSAWGVGGRGLEVSTENIGGGLLVRAKLGLAEGEAQLTLEGDPFSQTKVSLALRGCDPGQIGQLLNDLSAPQPKGAPPPAAKATPTAKLDLRFDGQLDLAQPRQIRGLGRYVLTDPNLKKVRLLGELSKVLEVFGVGYTTYELNQAEGRFGCLAGRAYFPDLAITGPQARLDLAGEINLLDSTLDFEGDFSLPRKGGFNPLELLNVSRTLANLAKIKLKGPISEPKITPIPTLKDIIKPLDKSELGKIPDGILE